MQSQSSDGAHPVDGDEHAWFTVEQIRGCVVVMASGELDLSTGPELRDVFKVVGEFCNHIIVDLTRVTLVDSSSLEILVEAREQALASDGTVALVGVTGKVHTAVHVTGLHELFPTYASVADAITGLTEHDTGASGEV